MSSSISCEDARLWGYCSGPLLHSWRREKGLPGFPSFRRSPYCMIVFPHFSNDLCWGELFKFSSFEGYFLVCMPWYLNCQQRWNTANELMHAATVFFIQKQVNLLFFKSVRMPSAPISVLISVTFILSMLNHILILGSKVNFFQGFASRLISSVFFIS